MQQITQITSTLLLLFALLLIDSPARPQKLKAEYYNKAVFIRPPKSDRKINNTYTWQVVETTMDQNFNRITRTYSPKNTNYGRGQFFANYNQLGSIPGFKAPQNGIQLNGNNMQVISSSLIVVTAGVAEAARIKPGTNGRVVPSNAQSPVALVYDVWVTVPLSFDMRYALPGEGVDEFCHQMLKDVAFDSLYRKENKKYAQKFQFPKDLKAMRGTKGFSTTGELDLQFTKHKRQFIKECKDKVIAAFLKEAKLEVESQFSYSKRKLPIRFYYIKDKNDTYLDLESYANIFKEVEPLLEANIKAGNRMNWFSPEIKTYTQKLMEFHNDFLQRTQLPELVKSAARYNRIWLCFLHAEFDKAAAEIAALKQLCFDLKKELSTASSLSKTTKKDYRETISAIGIFDLDKITLQIDDFKPRYLTHKNQLKW